MFTFTVPSESTKEKILQVESRIKLNKENLDEIEKTPRPFPRTIFFDHKWLLQSLAADTVLLSKLQKMDS